MPGQDVSHGMINWNELLTCDTQGAKAFYGELLGWELVDHEGCEGHTYSIIKAGGKEIGGIMDMPPEAEALKAPPHWGCYITVENVDHTAAKAKALGAQIVIEPRDIPGVGRFTVLRDPQGAIINFITYEGPVADHLQSV